MSSLFTTTHVIQHASPLSAGANPAKGVEMLHEHVFFIQCNPHMIKYEVIDTPASSSEPQLPSHRGLTGIAPPKCYQVTDKVHALPAGLWDSDAVSTYEFINLDKGVFVRIRGPLNITMETVWTIEEKPEGGGHQLKEDAVIKCSRLLLGVMRSTCESGWRGIHEKMVENVRLNS